MLRNKIKAAVIIALIAVNSVFAAEGYKPKEPKKGHVLVVGKIAYKKPIDIAAREKNFREYKNRQIVIGKMNDFAMSPDFANKTFDTVTDGIDGYFYQEIKVPKDGKLHLNNVTVYLFAKSNMWFQFQLPAGVTINVPDDAVYVYIGTFEYDLDYALRTVGFRHIDDYEEASKNLNRELGKKVELYRAPLTFDEADKSKK